MHGNRKAHRKSKEASRKPEKENSRNLSKASLSKVRTAMVIVFYESIRNKISFAIILPEIGGNADSQREREAYPG